MRLSSFYLCLCELNILSKLNPIYYTAIRFEADAFRTSPVISRLVSLSTQGILGHFHPDSFDEFTKLFTAAYLVS